jgi:lysozyme
MNNKLTGGILAGALALVCINEGIKYTAYQDSGGVWTICNGITKGVSQGDTATPAECEGRLMQALLTHAKPIERIPHKLPDHTVVAWADFCFNVGVHACQTSTGYKLLKQGRIKESCAQILRWRFTSLPSGHRVDCFDDRWAQTCGGIKTRRTMEHRLCLGKMTIDEAIKGLG